MFEIIQKPSPNFDERKDDICMIVIHATATNTLDETFSYLIHSAAPNRVSAHYVIDRDGMVYQLVDEQKRAWHAGVSTWDGKTDINSCSVGIEFQCPAIDDELGDFTLEQLKAGILLCREICKRYSITAHNVVRHSDIAPGRKKDPGASFPWDEFIKRVFE